MANRQEAACHQGQIETTSILHISEELSVKLSSTINVIKQPALALVILAALFFSQGGASAATSTAPQVMRILASERCDGNRVMHEATHRYRMQYDYPYAAAQRMAEATKQYRMFYDYPYAAAQRIAAATDRYCAGHP